VEREGNLYMPVQQWGDEQESLISLSSFGNIPKFELSEEYFTVGSKWILEEANSTGATKSELELTCRHRGLWIELMLPTEFKVVVAHTGQKVPVAFDNGAVAARPTPIGLLRYADEMLRRNCQNNSQLSSSNYYDVNGKLFFLPDTADYVEFDCPDGDERFLGQIATQNVSLCFPLSGFDDAEQLFCNYKGTLAGDKMNRAIQGTPRTPKYERDLPARSLRTEKMSAAGSGAKVRPNRGGEAVDTTSRGTASGTTGANDPRRKSDGKSRVDINLPKVNLPKIGDMSKPKKKPMKPGDKVEGK
jgi:hypothetical protein